MERFNEEVRTQPVRARLHLMRSLRSSRLVRYSRTHWVELNTCQDGLLEHLYHRINTIRSVRRAIICADSAATIHERTVDLERVPTFRLMQQLGREGLKRSN